mgnify:CR=1 FL=1
MTDRDETFDKVASLIEPFNKKKAALSDSTSFAGDLEWDSLTVMDFVAAIEDEFDIPEEEGDIFALADHTFRVSGDTPVARVAEAFGTALRSSDPARLEQVVRAALAVKRDAHGFELDGRGGPDKAMISIGG